MRSLRLGLLSILALAACGGGNNPDPTVVPGGGVANGGIDGTVHVYVIDDQSEDPISGATVYVGTIMGTTGADGLFTASGDSLSGPQDITAAASGYTSATWYGADGANVTVPLSSTANPAIPQATLTGTIAGWDGIAIPSNGGVFAFIGFSASNDDGDPANNLAQPTPPANVCQKTVIDPSATCDWSLLTRTGPQVVYAFIASGTQNGADITGFAFKTGVNVSDGVDQNGVSLTLAADADMETANVTLPSAPSGTDTVNAAARIDTGGDGRVQIPLSGIDQINSYTVPKASVFSGSTIDLVGIANSTTDSEAQSIEIVRGLDSVNSGSLTTFQALPSNLSTDGATFSFGAVTGASVHTLKVHDAAGADAWGGVILDDRTSVVLPDSVALPTGSLTFDTQALTVTDFDPQDFAIDTIKDEVTASSQAGVSFTN